MLHLTPTCSAYLENVWVWSADHDIDQNDQDQIDIYDLITPMSVKKSLHMGAFYVTMPSL